MINLKGQSAIEFLIIVATVLTFATIFIGAVYQATSDSLEEKRSIALNEIATTIREEVRLASTSSEGYERNFILPEKLLNGIDYEIQRDGTLVYLRTLDSGTATATEILNVTGDFELGENVIRKREGSVFVN